MHHGTDKTGFRVGMGYWRPRSPQQGPYVARRVRFEGDTQALAWAADTLRSSAGARLPTSGGSIRGAERSRRTRHRQRGRTRDLSRLAARRDLDFFLAEETDLEALR